MVPDDGMTTSGPGRELTGRELTNPGTTTLATLSYRSRAVQAPTPDDLEALLSKARERNKANGITGLLLHEQGRFFQWLEGPQRALATLWNSIQRDPRHSEIQVLGEGVTPVRVFGQWDMHLFSRAHQAALAEQVVLAHPLLDETVSRIATLAIEGQAEAIGALIEQLALAGHDQRTLCRRVFEPVARCLGDWWRDDRCGDFQVTLGLSFLQTAVRQSSLSSLGAGAAPGANARSVLVVPQPLEKHQLGSAMVAEFFRQAGWQVQVEYPGSDLELVGLMQHLWFDAVSLTSSDVFAREHRVHDLAATIRAVRAASKNPKLVVLVGGRAFAERPNLLWTSAGADVGYASAGDAVENTEFALLVRSLKRSDGVRS